MTISEKIFELMENREMSRKTFSERTGIALSTIADWKRKNTNPSSDKIMIISKVLDVTVEELLSGSENHGSRSNATDYFVISKDSEVGTLVYTYMNMDASSRNRLEGYMRALESHGV